jgi:hypothetical protein
MIQYPNSINAHFLFLLHLSYTFFRAPEAMSTLKFEDETATQLSRCIKMISSYVVFLTKYNSIHFLSIPLQKFPSSATKFSLQKHSWTHDYHWWVPHLSHGCEINDTTEWLYTVGQVYVFYWENIGERASNKEIMLHVFLYGSHHTDANV